MITNVPLNIFTEVELIILSSMIMKDVQNFSPSDIRQVLPYKIECILIMDNYCSRLSKNYIYKIVYDTIEMTTSKYTYPDIFNYVNNIFKAYDRDKKLIELLN